MTLAVESIQTLTSTDEAFTVAQGFYPKRHEAEAFGVVWERPATVVLRFARTRRRTCASANGTRRSGLASSLEMTFRAGLAFEITRWILG